MSCAEKALRIWAAAAPSEGKLRETRFNLRTGAALRLLSECFSSRRNILSKNANVSEAVTLSFSSSSRIPRELSRFLHERRQKLKQSCGPGRFYCIACRAPKAPAGSMADCTPVSPTVGNLCGICPDCQRLIYRRVNLAKIDAVRGDLDITFTQPSPRISHRDKLHDPRSPIATAQ
jgi:hypothetical protein